MAGLVHKRCTRFSPAVIPLREFMGDETVPEGGIVGMDFRAEARSCPDNFSMTTPRHFSPSACAKPCFDNCRTPAQRPSRDGQVKCVGPLGCWR